MSLFWILFNKWERFALVGLGILIVFLYFDLWDKDRQINNLEKERDQAEANYTKLLREYTINAQKYDKDLKEYKEKSKYISDMATTKIKYIKEYKGNKNETNCETANKLINDFRF